MLIRLLTTLLALTIVILGAMAAHHVQAAPTGASHMTIAEANTVPQPLVDGDSSVFFAAEQLAAGVATGCIVLIACCVLGSALISARAWRARLHERISAVARFPTPLIKAPPTALPTAARPSLVVLSISRT